MRFARWNALSADERITTGAPSIRNSWSSSCHAFEGLIRMKVGSELDIPAQIRGAEDAEGTAHRWTAETFAGEPLSLLSSHPASTAHSESRTE